MADNLQKLIQLAKADGGKFFVLDEKGEPVLVIMGVDEYEKVLLKKVQGQMDEIEEINKKINEDLVSEVIDSTFSFEPEVEDIQKRAELEDI